MRKLFWVFLLLFSTTAFGAKSLIVVRHAERTAGVDDLTPIGIERAKLLKDMFASEKIALILSTPLQRSLKTVVPLAQSQGMDITTYDTIDNLVAKVQASLAETILIVGHSNTVPEIVKTFSGTVVPPIAEQECDRFYVISLDTKSVLKLRYIVDSIPGLRPQRPERFPTPQL